MKPQVLGVDLVVLSRPYASAPTALAREMVRSFVLHALETHCAGSGRGKCKGKG